MNGDQAPAHAPLHCLSLPFGVLSVPSVFQHFMNDTFQDWLAHTGPDCHAGILMCFQEGALHAVKVQMVLAILH